VTGRAGTTAWGTFPRVTVILSAAASAVLLIPAQQALAGAAAASPSGASLTGTSSTSVAALAHQVVPMATTPVTPHGSYSSTPDACSTCHRAHTAKNANLLPSTAPQSKLCFTCHDGTGASVDVKSEYTDPAIPANDPATSSYYSHESTVATTHSLSSTDEFSGQLNRHTECSDCHNPHNATSDPATSSANGWSAGGPIIGASGVSVNRSTSPYTYTFLNGTANKISFEYQLCYKCHSGSTTLLTNTSGLPSRDITDVAKEFRPSGVSFHPVEAAGQNQTPKMALSLSGSSPFKLWNLTPTSKVRCTMCHAGSGTYALSPAAGGVMAPHTSVYRGLLLRKYEDRVLRLNGDDYSSADFALCFLCHTDSPFASSSTSATNFGEHGRHTGNIAGTGEDTPITPGTSIDVAGSGNGNALCAECHFRPHSTSETPEQNGRLVSFAPNVTAYNGVLEWRPTGVGSGSCTLICHGKIHDGINYSATP